MKKSGLCGLLTVVALVCGCDKGTKNAKVEGETAESQSNIVRLETSMGTIVIELNRQAAPVTVKNFIGYVESGFYDGTIFHRVIPGFMIQAGGFTKNLERKKTRNPIINEAKNGLSNKRGAIAMARTGDPNSATSQFFINHRDNTPLDYVAGRNSGYAVFGKVTEGMDVVDAIAAVKTTTRKDKKGVDMQDVPVEPVVMNSVRVVPQ